MTAREIAATFGSQSKFYKAMHARPMIGPPDFLIEGANRPDAVPGPAGSDVLSNVLDVFRVTGAVLLRADMTAPVAVDIPAARNLARQLHPGATRLMVLHIVAEGSCRLEVEGQPARWLGAGSIMGFPQGHPHRLTVGESARPVPAERMMPPMPWTQMPVLSGGGDGERMRMVCVYLRCDELLSNPILDSLPPVMAISPDEDEQRGWITATARQLVDVALQGWAGSGCLIARLTEVMFIDMLRRHISLVREGQTGWLAALASRQLARALACFHGQPARQWTLEEVAVKAGMSRSALLERFQHVLRMPPMRYLTLWRLQLAAQALRTTRKTTAQIAAEVGYGSEVALCRAFKRETGMPPATWRRHHGLGQDAPSKDQAIGAS